ncbi:MAG: acetate--CoA ligase family protein [bacterium]
MKNEVAKILERAQERGQKALSEYESKLVLKSYGIPVTKEELVQDLEGAKKAAQAIGYPVVLKACSHELTHKTEKGLIEVGIRDQGDLEEAFRRLSQATQGMDAQYLVQEMVKGARELVIGMTRDPQFGPCVMFGLGGIFTEILRDVSFRVAPIQKRDAFEMMEEIKGKKILEAIRGMEAVDRELLAQSLVALGDLGMEQEHIQEVDVNPMIIRGRSPVAVDALVVLAKP